MDTPGDVSRWLRARSTHLEDWPPESVLKAKRESADGSISVVLPALNERETVGAIVSAIRTRLMDEIPLVDELLVVDSGSTDDTMSIAQDAGARVLGREEILPRVPVRPGKGEVLWRSLLATNCALACFIDADLRSFDPAVIPALLGPLLTEPDVQLVKSAHERPLALPGATQVDKGGRVTELVARPLINLCWPQLAGIVQPLAGEYAARRSLLETLPFPTGYGVELALLVDTLERHGLDAIAQVDVGIRRHGHQSDRALGRMSAEILSTAMRRVSSAATEAGAAAAGEPFTLLQFERVLGALRPMAHEIAAIERPPMLSIPEYRYSRLKPGPAGEGGARVGAGVAAANRPGWLRVGLGPEASPWTTRKRTAKVLFVVHNVTSATRLMDVMPLFDGDLRVARFVTCTGSSPFQAGVADLFTELGLPSLPWEQAKSVAFDLVVSASYGGELHELQGKLAVLSHGMGYNKVLRRATGDGRRATGDGRRATAFGMSAEWLLHEGEPIADFTVLSHPELLARLGASCPEAAPTAVLAGDPCYDRLIEALPRRAHYRRSLGIQPGQRLIVLNSTWNPGSLFGDEDDVLPHLLDRLRTELPVDEYRTAAILHPNIWHGHGPGQIRAWLARARRAGMLLIPPLEGWRQTLIAADCLIGDHGSVSYYAAAIGRPVLLAAFPEQDLDPESPVAEFGRVADRLDPALPLRPQIDGCIRAHRPERFARLAGWASSEPGRSAELLRGLFYGALGIDEPEHAAGFDGLAPPPSSFTPPTAALRVLVSGTTTLRVTRFPEAADPAKRATADHVHLSVREDTPDFSALTRADHILGYEVGTGRAASDWISRTARENPHVSMVTACTGPGRAVARSRDGQVFTLRCTDHDGDPGCDPAPAAEALSALLVRGGPLPARAFELEVDTGSATHAVRVTQWSRAEVS